MYKIYADDTLIYDSTLEDYKIGKGSISLETDKSGSFTFSVYPDHFFYDSFVRLKTVITVYKSGRIIFRGRILNDVTDYWNNKVITCEGELGFLQDSVIRPFEFTGTPKALFEKFIGEHNSQVDEFKRFNIGSVTVVDPNNYVNRSSTDYGNTLSTLTSATTGSALGGHIYITHGDDGQNPIPTIHYVEDFTRVASQKIEFGSNLKNYTKTVKAEDIATAIIPLGATVSSDNERLTIADINNNVDYVYSEVGVALYGWIFKTVVWDDVTLAGNLKTKAEKYLGNVVNQNITIELNAIDLHLLDRSIESFNVCDYVHVVSEPHNFDAVLLCNKQTIDLLKPENDTVVLGYETATFTRHSNDTASSVSTLSKQVSSIKQDASSIKLQVETLDENVASLEIMADEIRSEVSDKVAGLNSTISQTADEIRSEVSAKETRLNSTISQTATDIRLEVINKETRLRSSITQTAEEIRTEMSDEVAGLNSSITQTADEIHVEMIDMMNGYNSIIQTTAKNIRSEIANEVYGLETKIVQTAAEIRSEVSDEVAGLSSTISQTATKIRSEVIDDVVFLNSKITQTAAEIRSEIVDEVAGLNSRITQTAAEIRSEVSNGETGSSSSLGQTATEIRAEIANEVAGLNSKINQTATSIRAELSSAVSNLESSINQNIDSITLSVTNGEKSSKLVLKSGSTTLSSATINFTGDVVFSSDLIDGTTIISGDCITTGEISSEYIKLGGTMSIYADLSDNNNAGWLGYVTGSIYGNRYTGIGMVATEDTAVLGSASDDVVILSVDDTGIFSGNNIDFHAANKVRINSEYLIPYTDNGAYCGSYSYWWRDGYFTSLHVNGSAITSSDKRVKENINYDLTKYLSMFDNLKPCTYKFIEGVRTHVGMIAQEVEGAAADAGIDLEHMAAVCIDENNDMYGLRYEEFVPLLIAKVQLLDAELRELKVKYE